MKKVLGILLALALTVALTVPVMADVPDVDTKVTVVGDASGSPPIIKAKWEKFSHYTDSGEIRKAAEAAVPPIPPEVYRPTYTLGSMTYDDDPTLAGIQVFPPGQTDPQGEIDVEYWAVVTDNQGRDDIVFVSADVVHPDTTPKYQVMLLQACTDYLAPAVRQAAIDEMTAADAAGAITYNEIMVFDGTAWVGTGEYYTLDDLIFEYEQNEAWIFMGVEWLDYHQPCGTYTVKVCAADQGLKKDYKENTFEYVKEASIALDFTSLNFGEVLLCKEVTISGDADMATSDKPTVKNLGNCDAGVNVHFDDMGFGWRTEDGVQVPNVTYDARLDLFEPVPVINPSDDTLLPGILPLCNHLKICFSIHVSKAEPGEYTGICTIWATDGA